MASIRRKYLLYLFVAIIIFLLDQVTKNIVVDYIGCGKTKPFIPGVINFTLLQNTGGAFSILKDYPFLFKVIGVINVIIFSYLAFCPTVHFSNIIKLGSAFILGGTFGNLFDRFRNNAVTDFIDIQLFEFAVFNLADVFIDIGVILILYGWLFSKKQRDIEA